MKQPGLFDQAAANSLSVLPLRLAAAFVLVLSRIADLGGLATGLEAQHVARLSATPIMRAHIVAVVHAIFLTLSTFGRAFQIIIGNRLSRSVNLCLWANGLS